MCSVLREKLMGILSHYLSPGPFSATQILKFFIGIVNFSKQRKASQSICKMHEYPRQSEKLSRHLPHTLGQHPSLFWDFSNPAGCYNFSQKVGCLSTTVNNFNVLIKILTLRFWQINNSLKLSTSHSQMLSNPLTLSRRYDPPVGHALHFIF